MPSKVGHVYHPGAANYFHPTGISDGGGRIGQPPTLLNLPPLQLNKCGSDRQTERQKQFDTKTQIQSDGQTDRVARCPKMIDPDSTWLFIN